MVEVQVIIILVVHPDPRYRVNADGHNQDVLY